MAARRRATGARSVFWTILTLCVSTGMRLPLDSVMFMAALPP
jgi:hypothetical protein